MLKTNLKTETAKDRLTRMALSNSGAGASPSVPAPAVMPQTASSGNTAKERLAKLAAQNSASGVYSMERPTVNVPKVNTPAATAPKTDASKTETAKQTTVAPKNATFWEKLGLYLSGSTDTTLPNVQANDSSELIAENLASGAVESAKGAVNLVNYYGQGAMRGKLATMEAQQRAQAAVTGDKGSTALADNFAKTRADSEAKGLTTTVNWGNGLKKDIAQRSIGADPATLKIAEVAGTVGGMLPSIAANAVLPGSSLFVMGGGAAGNAIEQAKAEGATDAGALTYGTAVGAIEAATEKMFDGVFGVFGKGVADDAVEKLVSKYIKGSAAQNAILTLTSMLGEGAEEFVAEVTENWVNRITAKTDNRRGSELLSDAGKSAAMGALVSALFQGAQVMQRGDKITPAQIADNAVAQTETGKPAQTVQNADGGKTYSMFPEGSTGAKLTAKAPVTESNPAANIPASEAKPAEAPTTAQDTSNTKAHTDTAIVPEAVTQAGKAVVGEASNHPPADNSTAERFASFKRRSEEYQARLQKAFDDNPDGMIDAQTFSELQRDGEALNKEYVSLTGEQRRADGVVSKGIDTPDNHIDNRTNASVASRSVKAFQFDHPEFHQYFSSAAEALQLEAEAAASVDSVTTNYRSGSKNASWSKATHRYKGIINDAVRLGLSKPEIQKCCEDIIQNNGQENYAAAKRVELILDKMLSDGYVGMSGETIPGNKEYISAKQNITGSETEADRRVRQAKENYEFADLVDGAPDAAELTRREQEYAALRAEYSDAVNAVGAAEKGFAGDYNAWQMDTKASDFHPEGENAARPVDLPKVNPQGENTMKTAATVMESQNTPDARVTEIEKYMADGKAAYIPVTDADAKAAAEATLEFDGWDKTLTDWTAKVRGNQVSKELVAQGAVLLNNAANSAATSQQYLDIFNDYAALLHNAGQSLQAARLLKTLSPEGRLYGITKSIESMVTELKGKADITLDPALIEEYRNASTDAQRDAAIDKIASDIARQTPSNFLDKWTALRYVDMLGNFKTQVRNIAGNVGMGVVSKVKRGVNSAVESVVRAATGGKYQKTASFLYSPALFKAALNDFQSVKSAAMGEGKYNDNTPTNAFERSVQDKRTIFKNNGVWGTSEGKTALSRSAAMKGVRKATGAVNSVMEAYRNVTNKAMEGGDYIFSIVNYADALAGYLKAHGVKADAVKASMDGSVGSLDGAIDAKLLDAARQYAIKEAQEATFRDTNAVSKWASQVGRGKNTPKAVKVVAEGVLPFRKTPANVAVRAEEYSPLGFINTTVKAIEASKGTGNVTGSDVINSLSKSLTGTGIFMLGYALTKAGLLRLKDKDEEKEAMAKLTGHQDYALELPSGTSITLDWLTPAAMPLFMGGAFYNAAAENGFQAKDIESTLTSLLDPMIEMSMVSGVNDALSNVKYSDSGIIQLVLSSGIGYLTQGLTNTLLGQIERTSEENRQSTYISKDSNVPSWLARQIGKASAKTPGFDYAQTDYVDAWGRKQSNGTIGQRVFNNFFNPAYVSKINETAVDKEIMRLYDGGAGGEVTPNVANKSFKVSGTEYNLSAAEHGNYQQTYGKYALDHLNTLFKSSEYKKMGDDERVKAISDVYSDATVEAKRKIVEARGEMYLPTENAVKQVDTYTGAGLSKDKAYDLYKTMDALVPETGKSEVSSQQKAKVVVQQGYGPKQTAALVGSLWNQSGAEEKKTLLPSLNVAQRLVTMYVSGGDSKLVSMTVPRSFSENNVAYTLTDAEMELFQTTYADYFNRNANNVMSEENLLRLREDAYNRAKYAVLRDRK